MKYGFPGQNFYSTYAKIAVRRLHVGIENEMYNWSVFRGRDKILVFEEGT